MAKNYDTIPEVRQHLTGVICDKCKRYFSKIKHPHDIAEFLSWENYTGPSSIFGVLGKVEVDLCQHCVKEVLGPYLKITPL